MQTHYTALNLCNLNNLIIHLFVSPYQNGSISFRLQNEMQFDPALAATVASTPAGAALIALKDNNFVISEGDPLLVVVPDTGNPDSVAYCNGGNYALALGAPGAVPWPGLAPVVSAVPVPGVTAPPHALGTFIAQQLGVADKSGGTGLVCFVDNLAHLHLIPSALKGSNQFRRLGPTMAALAGAPVQPFLVNAFTLDKINGPPLPYFGFNGD